MTINPYQSPAISPSANFVHTPQSSEKIQFELDLNDFLALNRHHTSNSPAIKRRRIRNFVVNLLVVIAGILYISREIGLDQWGILQMSVVTIVAYLIVFRISLRKDGDRLVAQLYRERSDGRTANSCRLEIHDKGIFQKTEYDESLSYWHSIMRIENIPEYTFVYIDSLNAFIIPHQKVTLGDPVAFVAELKHRWHTEVPQTKTEN